MKNIRFFLSENFPFLVIKFSIYLNRRVFVMKDTEVVKLVQILEEVWLEVNAFQYLYGNYGKIHLL